MAFELGCSLSPEVSKDRLVTDLSGMDTQGD